MRSLLGVLLVHILALLLVGTSPIGTGQGAHQGQLLDALIPHVHVVDGQLVQPGVKPPLSSDHPGPALGAGAGATATVAGPALTPPLPTLALLLPAAARPQRLAPADHALPRGRTEAPPDPPPIARS